MTVKLCAANRQVGSAEPFDNESARRITSTYGRNLLLKPQRLKEFAVPGKRKEHVW